MAEARLPSIASGNRRLLVTFATFKIQPAPGQAFEAMPEPIPPRYIDETNISTS
ncbi:hypothetical protein FOPG_17188 [Fusarium oxysporum f. sp. conglutinans race 2 54008]|uniref:Uncharacterized protein n=1 Tax=Fusarium oxysporum f. sp. conglutinans race 2 54008 TaxID=1089457 RepID=X0H3Q4_FUSOX|nr:hypothetical protein FOPG_17188 [Fusarium oxysporum f. sp. conglutinans race 2 54008]